MKRLLIIILISVLSFALVTCEENFSPKDEYVERNILNSIIRLGEDIQLAAVYKSFDVPGFNPKVDSSNLFIEGADITLRYINDEYRFKDTVITPQNDQRFEGQLKYYYLENFTASRDDEEVHIAALLPNGSKLTASARVPILYEIDRGQSAQEIPSTFHPDYINVNWFPRSFSYFQYYKYRLRIKYEIRTGESVSEHFVEVPATISKREDEEEYIYPQLTRQFGASYTIAVFESVLRSIGNDVPNKKNIFVSSRVEFVIVALDAHLAAYAFAQESQNIYSVRLDQTLYSNIEGGYGIFGITMERSYFIQLSESYVKRFGYSFIN